jgi:exopolysaccharide biosynthesis polyprenyl glycosylphosphotransferase
LLHAGETVNATERASLLQSVPVYDEMFEVVDDRTLQILDRRRRTAVRRRGWLVRRMLLVADVVGLILALLLAEWLASRTGRSDAVDVRAEILLFVATLPGWVVIAKLYGLYDHDEERTDHSTADDVGGVFHLATVCTWLCLVAAHVTHLARPGVLKLSLFWAAAVVFVSSGRALARSIARRQVAYVQNTVIVGAGEVGQLVAKKLLQHPEYGINLVGFVDDRPKERRDDLRHLTLLGGPDRLTAIVRLFDVERVIIAFSNDDHQETLRLIRSLKDLDVQIDIVPRLFELVGTNVGMHTVEGLPLFGLAPPRLAKSSKLLKRTMDLPITLLGVVLLAPVFLAIAVAIKLDSRGPVFFRQVRMGYGNRTFRIWKFRTMSVDADERKHEVVHLNKHLGNGGDPRMFKIPDDPRVTRVGRFLRRHSLDELPQLFNVLVGEMSLVGPRPLIVSEDECVTEWARQRLRLKPGVTGLWQVLGRDDIPFQEMVKLDYLYVNSWSLGADLKLVVKTLPVMFGAGRRGI